MSFKKLAGAIGALALVAVPFIMNAQAAPPVGVIDLDFKSYVESGQPEQDVFVQSASDPSQVVRLKPEEAQFRSNLEKEAFAAAEAVPHDPYGTGASPLGPFNRGADLGFDMQAWLAAQGSGSYILREDDSSALRLSFHKLVPNAIYTVLCSRVTLPPNPTADEKTCAAMDGSESALKTDANGNSNFNLELKSPLPDSATGTGAAMTVIALDYHSDGKTCDGTPCQFGLNSHVQLSAVMPDPSQLRREETRLACQARTLKEKTLALNVAWTTLLSAQKSARQHRADQLKAGSAAHKDAVKTAWANRRTAEADARDARNAAIKQANADYVDANRAAATKDDREIARENRAAALDKADSDRAIADDTSTAIFHAMIDKAETTWDADQNAAQTDFDTAMDGARTAYDLAKARALSAFHSGEVDCLLAS